MPYDLCDVPVPSIPARLVESQTDFDALFPSLLRGDLLAVDTEAASFHRYHDRIYLVQLSSRDASLIVDPLKVLDLGVLGQALASPALEVVFHDADYDLRLFDHQFGFRAARVFDTRIAAQFLNEPGIGLAALLEKYMGVRADKRFQRADWSARPLSPAMLAYAESDTAYLPALRDVLRSKLQEMGRLSWAEEEFALLETVRWADSGDAEPGWLRIKGAKAMAPREMAVLRELWQWREEEARRLDRAPFRILNNEPMLSMARTPPGDLVALGKVSGVGAETAERRGRKILAAVQRAISLPEASLPRLPKRVRRPPDLLYEARVDRLKLLRNELAVRYELQPGVLCANQILEAVARANPRTLDELAAIPSLRRWQLAEFGAELLPALSEPAPTP